MKLKIELVVANNCVTKRQAKKVFKKAQNKFRAVGVKLRLKKVHMVDVGPVFTDSKWPYRYPHDVATLVNQKLPLTELQRHILCPLIPENRLGGMAPSIPAKWSVSTAGLLLDREARPLVASAVMMAHELGHALGLEHRTHFFNLMNKGINQIQKFHFKYYDFTDEQGQTMKECIHANKR